MDAICRTITNPLGSMFDQYHRMALDYSKVLVTGLALVAIGGVELGCAAWVVTALANQVILPIHAVVSLTVLAVAFALSTVALVYLLHTIVGRRL